MSIGLAARGAVETATAEMVTMVAVMVTRMMVTMTTVKVETCFFLR